MKELYIVSDAHKVSNLIALTFKDMKKPTVYGKVLARQLIWQNYPERRINADLPQLQVGRDRRARRKRMRVGQLGNPLL